MKIASVVDFFIAKDRFTDRNDIRRTRLFVRACLLTSLFSNSYVWSSFIFGYEKGVYLMIFNMVGFLLLPFLARTKLSIVWLGNLYIFIGAFAVIVLTYYSGGLWSAIYPWIISIPVLALLVVNKFSGAIWGVISFIVMIWFGVLAIQGVELPVEYNTELKTIWFVTVVPGLLLIVLFISFVFEAAQSKALVDLEEKNEQLNSQKETIGVQSTELEKLIEEKDYIIRILAHDLRNPLKNITGLVNLLKNDQDTERQGEYVDMIMQSSLNAQDLVSKVLEMDVTDQKDIAVEFTTVSTSMLLLKVIAAWDEIASKKEIEILIIDNTTINEVKTDETYLKLIIDNLLSNAIKFSEVDKKITIELSNLDSSLRIKITDEGPGVSQEEEDQLFRKFARLSTRPTAGESSTGLGLSLVKRYVQLIGGKVWYESNEGVGATFIVELSLDTLKVRK